MENSLKIQRCHIYRVFHVHESQLKIHTTGLTSISFHVFLLFRPKASRRVSHHPRGIPRPTSPVPPIGITRCRRRKTSPGFRRGRKRRTMCPRTAMNGASGLERRPSVEGPEAFDETQVPSSKTLFGTAIYACRETAQGWLKWGQCIYIYIYILYMPVPWSVWDRYPR